MREDQNASKTEHHAAQYRTKWKRIEDNAKQKRIKENNRIQWKTIEEYIQDTIWLFMIKIQQRQEKSEIWTEYSFNAILNFMKVLTSLNTKIK